MMHSKTKELNFTSVNPLAIMDLAVAELELTKSQYDEAVRSYKAVGEALLSRNSGVRDFTPNIVPQGSMRLGTTVKPIGQEHFDLDMVCHLRRPSGEASPESVYNLVWNALGSDETYRSMRVKLNRCIRVDYAKERRFHLDVIPAVDDEASLTGALKIPDRKQKQWSQTHPIAFADDWFMKIAAKLPTFRQVVLANARSAPMASMEDIPDQGTFNKTPLQRIVQILKRSRDEHFVDDTSFRPSSILLTTLVARSYEKQIRFEADDLLGFVEMVIRDFPNFITIEETVNGTRYRVDNPVNPNENFAEGWTDENYRRFLGWHSKAAKSLKELVSDRSPGIDVLANRIGAILGKDPTTRAVTVLGERTRRVHAERNLHVNSLTGALGLTGASVAPTVFFGE